jgi:hypothetical protein
LGNTTYTPDFYLPEFDCYIEIKGWWYKQAKLKFNKWKKVFQRIVLVLYKKQLKQIGVIS